MSLRYVVIRHVLELSKSLELTGCDEVVVLLTGQELEDSLCL